MHFNKSAFLSFRVGRFEPPDGIKISSKSVSFVLRRERALSLSLSKKTKEIQRNQRALLSESERERERERENIHTLFVCVSAFPRIELRLVSIYVTAFLRAFRFFLPGKRKGQRLYKIRSRARRERERERERLRISV